MNLKAINIQSIIFLLYSMALILLPYYSYNSFGESANIFPASDICILYYLCSYKNLHNINLFVIGILIDSMIGIPIGISSLAFISANIVLKYLENLLILKRYLTNITLFVIYCLYIIIVRYFLTGLLTDYKVDILAVSFLVASTIASYPIWHYLMTLPDSLFKWN